MSLFDDSTCALFDISQEDFIKKVQNEEFGRVMLWAHQYEGFYIIAENKDQQLPVRHVLATSTGVLRLFKNLDTAHQVIMSLGVKEYQTAANQWDSEAAYNPHELSRRSRQKREAGRTLFLPANS